MSSRAGIIVTGTEVLTGRVTDRNGPWLAEQLRVIGVDIAHVIIVGDRPEDLRRSLMFLGAAGVDLIITSGGLGPTADDLTAAIVAEVQGRPSQLDAGLEQQIADIVNRLSAGRGWRLDPEATAASVRKQALVPVGATVIAPVGTAPGLIVAAAEDRSGPPVVVLPGPPRELQGMWPTVIADPIVLAALAERDELHQRTIRLWGTPESDLAANLRELGPQLDDLEITTCLRNGELEIVTRYGPSAQDAYDAFQAAMVSSYPDTLFSADGRTIDQVIADLLVSSHRTIATAESCTAGLVAGRLTDLPGSSAYLLGGLVVYSNAAKRDVAGVPDALLERVGAVSPEVAQALADGARERLHATIGIGITGIAGPGGGTAEKPVGLVYMCVSSERGSLPHKVMLPGSRSDVRGRSIAIALHLIRQFLATIEASS